MIAIVILAAGGSTRMRGRDKLMEQVDGMPLLRRQVLRATATGAPVLVTLPPAPHARYDALEGCDVTLVPVADADSGMNASLSAGTRAVPEGAQAAMIVLADMPEVTTADMTTMLDAVDTNSTMRIWRATTQDGAQGHPTVFHKDLFAQLRALSGDTGGRAVVQAHQGAVQQVPLPDSHARTDLDTPEDWAAWRASGKAT